MSQCHPECRNAAGCAHYTDEDEMADKLAELRNRVSKNAKMVKNIGEWPNHIDEASLVDRVPDWNKRAAGFDAGIACALRLIPGEYMMLSATLHANYSPEAIAQVQKEIALVTDDLDPKLLENDDSHRFANEEFVTKFAQTGTCWWLCACYFCKEGSVDGLDFIQQIRDFQEGSRLKFNRVANAIRAWRQMQRSYKVVEDIAIAIQDGGMQAAYVHGHMIAIQPMHDVWFVGTFLPSLCLPEDYPWGTDVDEDGRPLSGPVHGSKQFVKCATFDELHEVLSIATEQMTWKAVAETFQKVSESQDRIAESLEALNAVLTGETNGTSE